MNTTDIIVIGGGIAGIGVAAMLSESSQVIVLERESQCGYHTTGRSAAMHVPSYGPAAMRRLTVASEAYLATPPSELNTDSILTQRGELIVGRLGEEATLEAFAKETPTQQLISAADAVDLVPILNPSRLCGAVFESNARDIDVDRLLQSWLRLASGRHCSVRTNKAVTAMRRVGAVWQVTAGDMTLEAPIVVNAAGAWADVVAGLAQQQPMGLQPCRRSAGLLPPSNLPTEYQSAFLQWPMFAGVEEDWYARPMGGHLMVSPADEDPVEPHDAFADEMRLAEGVDNFEQMVNVEVSRVEHTWGGLRTFSADREPVVGYSPSSGNGSAGFFWLAGQGGYGIQTAPALSRLAADLILQQSLDQTSADLAGLLNPVRFVH